MDKPGKNLSHVKDTRVFSPYKKYLEGAKSRAQIACKGYQGFGGEVLGECIRDF